MTKSMFAQFGTWLYNTTQTLSNIKIYPFSDSNYYITVNGIFSGLLLFFAIGIVVSVVVRTIE